MKKAIATVLGMSLLGVGLYVSQASAAPVQCDQYTTSFFTGQSLECYFDGAGGYDWGWASGESVGAEINPGVKGLIGDLKNAALIPNTWYAHLAAMGYYTNGGVISGCRANDTSTVSGQSGVDGDGGCENAGRHRLLLRVLQ